MITLSERELNEINDEAEKAKATIAALLAEVERLTTQLASTESHVAFVTGERERFAAQREEWRQTAIAHQAHAEKAEVERDAYKRAKEENDDRFMRERDEARAERDGAIEMLADWCAAIDRNGTGWDDWDEFYKDAAYRPGPLRELLDVAIADAKGGA